MNDNMKIVEKAKKIIAESDAMYIAYLREDGYPRVSTITMMKADGIKTIYTSTAIDGLKTQRVLANPKVSLCFRNGFDNITLTGTVEVSQDNKLREELWRDWCWQHFPDGPTGELFCVYIFTTEEASLWIDGEAAEIKGFELIANIIDHDYFGCYNLPKKGRQWRLLMDYKIKLNSFYLCVKDIKRAVDFYEQLLNQKVEENGSLFIINGIRFWLFDYQAANDNRVVFGHNCLPSFEVDDIKALMRKLEELRAEIVFPLTRIGSNWVLEFRDSEGNDIEVYSRYRPLDAGKDENYQFY